MRQEARLQRCIRQFQEGDSEGAFFDLKEMGPEVLPDLQVLFRGEPEADVRAFIARVVWEHRDPSVIPFLGGALEDTAPAVWQEALDGLVTLASERALEVLHSGRKRDFARKEEADEFRRWVDEAIGQVNSLLARRP